MDSLLQNAEDRIIESLKEKTEQAINEIGRPQQVYKIKKEKAALIVVDMQNWVSELKGFNEASGLPGVISKINSIVDLCHEKGIPVIWVKQNFTDEGGKNDSGLYTEFHTKSLTREETNKSYGTELFDNLNFDKDSDYEVFKNRYSAFRSSSRELEKTIEELGRTQLIFVGAATNVCVESTIRDAMQLCYEVIAVSDATAAADRVVKEVSLMNIRLFFGDVRNTADVLVDLN